MTELSTVANEAAVPGAAAQAEPVRTPWSEFWRKFRRQHLALAAGVFVILLVIVAVLSPQLVPYDPENYFDYDALNAGPSAAHTGSASIRWAATSSAASWPARASRWPPASFR